MGSVERQIKPLGIVLPLVAEKGGVGKTTTTAQLGRELSERLGYLVCLVDNDPQGNMTRSMVGRDKELWPDTIKKDGLVEPVSMTENLYHGYQAGPCLADDNNANLYFFAASDELIKIENAKQSFRDSYAQSFVESIDELRNHFDFIIIDNGPSVGMRFAAALSTAANGAGGALLPYSAQEDPVLGVVRVLERIKEVEKSEPGMKINIVGAFMTMFEKQRESCSEAEALAKEYFGDIIMPTIFHVSEHIRKAQSEPDWVGFMYRGSRGANELKAFAEEVVRRVTNAG
jgi:chromosome partitioning protein